MEMCLYVFIYVLSQCQSIIYLYIFYYSYLLFIYYFLLLYIYYICISIIYYFLFLYLYKKISQEAAGLRLVSVTTCTRRCALLLKVASSIMKNHRVK